jgi:hypothetical protein
LDDSRSWRNGMDKEIEIDLKVETSPEAYKEALVAFDAAVCDACAVGQAIGVRQAEAYAGYATYLFARICSHAISMIRALPSTRWVRSDFDHWDFGAVAGHARAIAEGHLTFAYLAETPESSEQWSAKLNVMHLCDCTRRITMFRNLQDEENVQGFEAQRLELQQRLNGNAYFQALPEPIRKQCLNGKFLTIENRDQLIKAVGWDPKQFNVYFDLLSQHTHILTMSFYRMEPEGRGTGLENETDRGYMTSAMKLCTNVLQAEVERLCELFPDVQAARAGIDSKFSPGPRANLPAWRLAQLIPEKARIKKRQSKKRK